MNHCSYCCLYSHNLVHHCCVCQCPYHSTHQCPLLSGQTKINCCGNVSKSLYRNKGEESSVIEKNETEEPCLEDDDSEESTQLKSEFPKNVCSSKVEQSGGIKNLCAHGVLSCCNLCCSGVLDGTSYCCKQCALKLMETYEKYSINKPFHEKLSEFTKNNGTTNVQLDSSYVFKTSDWKYNDEKEDIIECNNCTMIPSKRKESLTRHNKQDIPDECDTCKITQQREQLSSNKLNLLGIPIDCLHKNCKRTHSKFQESPEKQSKKEILVDCETCKLYPPKRQRSFEKQSKEKTLVDYNNCKMTRTHNKSCDKHDEEDILDECDTCKLYPPKRQCSFEKQSKEKTLVDCNNCKMTRTHKKSCDKHDEEEIPVECDTCKMIQPKRQSSQHKNIKEEILVDCNSCKKIRPQQTSSAKANEQDALFECDSCKTTQLTKCPDKVSIQQVFNDGKQNLNECRKCGAVTNLKFNELIPDKKLICYEIPTNKEITADCETCILTKPECVQVFDHTKNVGSKFIECKNCQVVQRCCKCPDSNETKGVECIDVIDFKCSDCKEIIIKCNNCMMKRQLSNHYLEISKKPEKKKGSFFSCCNNAKKRERKSKSRMRS